MTQYIDKSAVVAEIEKRQRMLDLDNPLGRGGMVELQVLKDKIDTLEVKEVDLDKEIPSKELADEIDALSKRYPEISFAKLSRIAVRIARWQKDKMSLQHPTRVWLMK